MIIIGGLLYCLYIGFNHGFSPTIKSALQVVALAATFSTIIQIAVFRKEPVMPLISGSAIFDALTISILLIILGEWGTIFFPFYLWQIVGYGVRFGLGYMKIISVSAVLGFVLVICLTPYWRDNATLACGLLLTLAIIPLYLAKLITRLNAALDHATEANNAKSQFLANMSHELRTPLTGIIASADMLKDENLGNEIQAKVDMIGESANTLMSMIHDVLDVSKVESGRLKLNRENGNLLAILQSVKNLTAPQAQAKDLDYIVEMDPAMFKPANLAATEIQQVLINLIGNAIKFTNMGSITLRGRIDNIDGQPGWRFEIQDTGIGMPKDVLENIFDPFVQVDTGITRQYSGTGLGTAICKEFVTLMGGYIGVKSELEKGSTFWFKIPVRYTEETQNTAPITTAQLFSIALIDDEKEQIRKVFGDTLITDLDFDNPERALQRLLTSENPVLLSGTDLSTHRFEQITNILTQNKLGNTPVVRLGQDVDLYRVCHAINNQKSIQLATTKDTSVATIQKILSLYLHKPNIAQDLKPIRPLEILVADDARTNRDILRMMLEKQGHNVTLAHDGLDAMENLNQPEQQFELVILDRNMPGMDGITVLNSHRVSNNWKQGNQPKFVLLTADASKETRRAAIDAGMDSFMTKPLLANDMRQEILRLFPTLFVEAPRPKNAGNLELAVDNTQANTGQLIDYQVLHKLGNMSPDGAEFSKRMVNSFLGDAKKMTAELNIGFRDQDYGQTLDAAHALKGSALQIGAPKLSEYCDGLRKIERIDFTAEKCRRLNTELNKLYDNTLEEFTGYLKELAASEDHSSSSKPQ